MYHSVPLETVAVSDLSQDKVAWLPLPADQSSQTACMMSNSSTDDPGESHISRTLYLCKLPTNFSETQIREICAPFGELRKITYYTNRQISFVEYWDIRDAQKARNTLQNITIGGRPIDVQYSKTRDDRTKDRNTGTLYVRPATTERNFQDPNTLQQYRELFERFGEVKKVNTNRRREAEKFIEYHDLRAAEEALNTLNGMTFNGVKLEVQYANQSSKTVINKDISNSECIGNIAYNSATASPATVPTNFRREDNVPSVRDEQPWRAPLIKLKWLGTAGPSAVMASLLGTSVNEF